MIRNFKRSFAVLGVVAATSAALVACGDETSEATGGTEGGNGTDAAEGIEGEGTAGTLEGEGASSQQNAMAYFGERYSEAIPGAVLAYNATGSGSGRTQFVDGVVDFAGSDSPLTDEQVTQAQERCGGNEAWHLPLVIGPVAVAYNLPGVDELNLDIPTVAQIFSGEITEWNDPAIAEQNPDVELPDTPIGVVYRSDESGTSDNFQKFLSTAAPDDWDSEGQQFPQGTGEGANGSNGVATQVSNIEGGITYVESGFADQQGLSVANLDFGSGPTELNADNVNTALEALEFTGEGHNLVVDVDALFAQNQEGSYPLILTPYSIVCSAGYDEETSSMVKEFLTVALNSQDEELQQEGYIPVEGAHHDRLREAVDALQ